MRGPKDLQITRMSEVEMNEVCCCWGALETLLQNKPYTPMTFLSPSQTACLSDIAHSSSSSEQVGWESVGWESDVKKREQKQRSAVREKSDW